MAGAAVTSTSPSTEDDHDPIPRETVLVTGYPSFTAVRFIKKVLATDGEFNAWILPPSAMDPEVSTIQMKCSGRRAMAPPGPVCGMTNASVTGLPGTTFLLAYIGRRPARRGVSQF